MSRLLRTAALAASCALAMPAAAQDRDDTSAEMTRGEMELAKLLEGRVAGEPQSCINDFRRPGMITIDGTALVFRQGSTLWVNRTENPDRIDDSDRLVVRKFNATRTCRLDQVTTEDRFTGIYTGNLFLSDFVPYRRAD